MPDRNQLIAKLQGFDAAHYARTERYARQIDRLCDAAAKEYAELYAGMPLFAPDENKPFSFDDYPTTKAKAGRIAKGLAAKLEATITSGSKAEWLAATYKNDAFLGSILRTAKLTKEELSQYEDRNLEALKTFQQRKIDGLNLSQRVWKYTGDLRDAMELGIDVALGEGKSAQQLSRDLRQYLREPDKLFRRVRDKGGNLRLSKAAAMYHCGQGVYRSSAKNAQRLARTEINMAYRESEWLRWQNLDFVVGFRVCLSNNHTVLDSKGKPKPLNDICDRLAGVYPKTFKFVGWHPNCRCYVIPILSDYDEYNKNRANRLKAIVKGQEYKSLPSRRTVSAPPQSFTDYVAEIAERAKGWKSMPYYIRDNFVGGKIEGGLKGGVATKQPTGSKPEAAKVVKAKVEPCTEYDGNISTLKRWAYAFGLDVSQLDVLRNAGKADLLRAEVERLEETADNRQQEWIAATNELLKSINLSKKEGFTEIVHKWHTFMLDNDCRKEHYYADCIAKLKAAALQAKADYDAKIAERAKSGDKPHPAIKTRYLTNEAVRDTIDAISAEQPTPWFRNGRNRELLVETDSGNNGSTNRNGRIWLTSDRLRGVRSALEKIGKGASQEITETEADAMATYWHEITHNRHSGLDWSGTRYSMTRRNMELANEFTARHSLPEFYKALGCKETPHPSFISNRGSTGYNRMVTNYDFIIDALKLDRAKVEASVRAYLFEKSYETQDVGLKQALIDGGLKKPNGKAITKKDLNKMFTLARDGSRSELKQWLEGNGYLKGE